MHGTTHWQRSSKRGLLAMQGADTVIYERLDPANRLNAELKGITRTHMELFGAAGLRTLCLSYARLDPQEYDRYSLGCLSAVGTGQARQFMSSCSMLDGHQSQPARSSSLRHC